MIRQPLKFYAILFSAALLILLAITGTFHILNAPVERDIAEIRTQVEAMKVAAAAHDPQRMEAQKQRLEKTPEPEPVPSELAFIPLDVPLDTDIQRTIYDLCKDAGVPFEVVMGLAWRESRFRPDVVSKTRDHGMMQINEINHDWLRKDGITDFYDPVQSVQAALRILAPLWEKYEPHKALMCYQYGETGAKGKWVSGQTTSSHSRQVMEQAAQYGFTI